MTQKTFWQLLLGNAFQEMSPVFVYQFPVFMDIKIKCVRSYGDVGKEGSTSCQVFINNSFHLQQAKAIKGK